MLFGTDTNICNPVCTCRCQSSCCIQFLGSSASCRKSEAYHCLFEFCANCMCSSKILLCIRGEGLSARHEESLDRPPCPSWWSQSTCCWGHWQISTKFGIGGQYCSCQLVLFDPVYHSCDACAPFSEHSVASDTSQLYALHDLLNTTCRHRMDWFVWLSSKLVWMTKLSQKL